MNCEFIRRSRLAGFPVGTILPQRWMWIVNELTFELNKLRRTLNLNVTEIVSCNISGLTDLHQLAIAAEYTYICEQCQLSQIQFGDDNEMPNSVLPLAEFTPELSDDPVNITIRLIKKKDRYYTK